MHEYKIEKNNLGSDSKKLWGNNKFCTEIWQENQMLMHVCLIALFLSWSGFEDPNCGWASFIL